MKSERLKKYWEYKGCKRPADFARLIGGIAASNISEIDKRDNNTRLLLQIKNTPECSDLNIDWLLTGEGKMILPPKPVVEYNNTDHEEDNDRTKPVTSYESEKFTSLRSDQKKMLAVWEKLDCEQRIALMALAKLFIRG